jgi:arylsulfatase A-like enzyme
MDSQLGRFFDVLKSHGLYDSALIAVVADHGEFLGERGLFSHSYRLDRELTAIPMLIKWPNQTEGTLVDDLVSHVDLFPTVAALAGLDVSAGDGLSLTNGGTDALRNRELVYLEEHESRFHQLDGRFRIADHLFGLQRLHSREVVFPGFIECARRQGDEWMTTPCVADWEDRLTGLPAKMQETLSLATDYSAEDLDDETADRLRALGYLE